MKKILFIIIFILMASPSFATTYYAQGAGNMDEVEWDTASGGGGTDLVWANRLAGDVFNANNLAITIDADPGVSGSKVVLTNPAGGTFTVSGNITVTADVGVDGDRGSVDCLVITTGTVTVLGNIYGGDIANADGLYISGAATVTIGAEGSPVTIKGGTSTSAYGVNAAAAAIPLTIYANVTGGSGIVGHGIYNGSTSASTITGNITGGSGTDGCGVSHRGSGAITLTGNLIDANAMAWCSKSPVWTVGNTSYHQVNTDSAKLYVSTDPGEANVKDGTTYYIQGASKEGSMSSGGGGAWGF